MTESQATDEAAASAGARPGEPAPGEGEEPRDLSLPELMRRAMLAQGKVDPDEVFATEVELDDDAPPPAHPLPPPDPDQEALFLDALRDPEAEPDETGEERSYTWEP